MPRKKLPAPTTQPRQWLTLREASDFLGIHYTTLRNWADKGDVPVYRTPGGHRRFRLAELRRFLESRASAAPAVNVDGMMANALGRIRDEMSRLPISSSVWRQEMGKADPEGSRERGRQLFALALNFVMRPHRREQILEQGREVGRAYGREAARHRISLAETGRAVQFFRRQILEAVRRDDALDPEDVRIRQTLAAFLDEVLYSVLDGYEAESLGASDSAEE